MLDVLEISLLYGCVYALVAYSVGAISYRLLHWPDLSCDAAFAAGGVVTAVAIWRGLSPLFGLALSFAAGAALGAATGILSTRLNINKILAGILVMTIGYSLNLRIAGRPNVSLLNERTLLTPFEGLSVPPYLPGLLVFGSFALLVLVLLSAFLHTNLGIALRATGDNPLMAAANGIPVKNLLVLGLALSNGLVGLAGSLVAQFQGVGDVNMGTGTIIIGLASMLMGEALFRPTRPILLLLAALAGAMLYELIINVALRLGLPPTDLKMATGFLVIAALALRYRRGGWQPNATND